MPSLITHYLCGDKSFNMLQNGCIKDIIDANRKIYNLGTQGPDIFFFQRLIPGRWTRKGTMAGESMHREKVGEFFKGALEYIANESGDDKDLLTAYMLGFTCHYALDSTTHPFIYYMTGFRKKGEEKTYKYHFYHHKYEKILDFLMLQREKGINPRQFLSEKLISVNRREALTIGEMYMNVFKAVYGGGITEKEVAGSISAMIYVYVLLSGRWNFILRLLSRLEKGITGTKLITSYMYPDKVDNEVDYLNLEHSPWFLPWDDKAIRMNTFLELYQNAFLEAEQLYKVIYSCLYGTMDINSAVDRIGNMSFSTGEDCTLDIDFKYYDCIFERTVQE